MPQFSSSASESPIKFEELGRQYREEFYPLYSRFAESIAELLEKLLKVDIAQIEYRAKDPKSFMEKVGRKGYADPLRDTKDLAGVRVITYYNDDVDRVADLLRAEFEVDARHSADKASSLDVDEFGYRSFHLVCRLSSRRELLPEWQGFAGLYFEVQVRSVLQHAWAAVSHKVDYKSAEDAPRELRRRLFRLSALLEMADDEFTTLRDESEEVRARYERELRRGELDLPLNLDSLAQYLQERQDAQVWKNIGEEAGFATTSARSWGDLGPLLETLQLLRVGSIAELDDLLAGLRGSAVALLQPFAEEARARGLSFAAFPYDTLHALLVLGLRDRLPKGYRWGEPWRDEISDAMNSLLEPTDGESAAAR